MPVACPAEALLREWAATVRAWNAMRKKSAVKWPDEETTYAAYVQTTNDLLRRATAVIARSNVGAAFQALLLYGSSPIHTDREPAGLTEEQKAPFDEHEDTITRIGLSVYRQLASTCSDRDLDLYVSRLLGPDKLAAVFVDAGFDLMVSL